MTFADLFPGGSPPSPPHKNAPLTPGEIRWVLWQRYQGCGAYRIAAALGRTKETIYNLLKRFKGGKLSLWEFKLWTENKHTYRCLFCGGGETHEVQEIKDHIWSHIMAERSGAGR